MNTENDKKKKELTEEELLQVTGGNPDCSTLIGRSCIKANGKCHWNNFKKTCIPRN